MRLAWILCLASLSAAADSFERGDLAAHLAIVRNGLCCYSDSAVFDAQGNKKNLAAPRPEPLLPRQEDLDVLHLDARGIVSVPTRSGGVFSFGGGPKTLPRLARFDASGHIVDVDVLPAEAWQYYAGYLDVFSDQCTVAYAAIFPGLEAQIFVTPERYRTVRAYDMCNNRSVDLAKLPAAVSPYDSDWPTQIRQLPDGGLLVQTSTDVWRLDRTGQALKRWPVRGDYLTLTPDGDGFWIELPLTPPSCWDGCVGHLVRFDLAGPPTPMVEITLPGALWEELFVNGEFRAALQPPRRRSMRH